MSKRKYRLAILLSVALPCATTATAIIQPAPELPASTPWNLAELSHPPVFRWLDDKSPIHSLAYAGYEYQGRATEIFAYYATPGSISGNPGKDKNLPAVVLIHGGGGTAFAEWVNIWAKRGYAAIAMDLGGKRLDPPTFDPKTRELVVVRNHREITRHPMENGGPAQGHEQKFKSIGGPKNDHWPYHAVANAIRAHSLIRSFTEVDQNRTAVTGISWGGYTTCIVAALDNRFNAAVPVYGCGFLADGESVQRPAIEKLGPELGAKWRKLYDPSSYLRACRVPILFVNGAKDIHYPLGSYTRSYDLVKEFKSIRIEPNMRHGHPPGWEPKEIGIFIDSQCTGAAALPSIGDNIARQEHMAVAQCRSSTPVKSATLHYTSDSGLKSKRKWQSLPAEYRPSPKGGDEIAARIPAGTTAWLFTVTDARGAMISSRPILEEKPTQ